MFSLDQQDVNSSCNLKSLHMHSLEGALKSILKWKNVLSSGGKILMFCFNGFFWGKKKKPTMGFVNWNFTYIMLLHSK